MQAASDWDLFYVLHSLDLDAPYNTDYLAFVPGNDPRIRGYLKRRPEIEPLITGFTDQFGHEKSVSALLMRTDAPSEIRTLTAVAALRNVWAMSSVIRGIEEWTNNPHGQPLVWSSFFDFYPVYPGPDTGWMHVSGPAWLNADEAAQFKGQTSPALPNLGTLQPRPDPMLVHRLRRAWDQFVFEKPVDPRTVALFRSLDVSYQAASVPLTPSVFEYGTRVVLWVSALEILANARSSTASPKTVIDLLEAFQWRNRQLAGEQAGVHQSAKEHEPGLVSRLYKELYYARNDFVHGNPLPSNRLFPFRDQKLPPLHRLPALIYKVALYQFVEELDGGRDEDAETTEEMEHLWRLGDLERALLKADPSSTGGEAA